MAAPYSLSGYARTVGAACKFTVRQLAAQEKIWSTAAGAFVTRVAADIANYGITAAPAVVGDKLQVGNIPTTSAGLLIGELWELAGASLALTDDLAAGPLIINWSGTDINSVSSAVINNAFTFNPVESAETIQFAIYWRGSGFKIRFTASPPTPIDVSNFAVYIGTHGTYNTFTEALGNLIAVDETLGIFDADPTIAQSALWPLEECIVEAWRTDGDNNTGPVFSGRLKIRRTLRGG